MKNTYTVTLGGVEYDVDVIVEADMYEQRGRYSGPPEDCYPDDSECDITDIKVLTEVPGYSADEVSVALYAMKDKLIEDLWDDYRDAVKEALAEAAIARYEARCEY